MRRRVEVGDFLALSGPHETPPEKKPPPAPPESLFGYACAIGVLSGLVVLFLIVAIIIAVNDDDYDSSAAAAIACFNITDRVWPYNVHACVPTTVLDSLVEQLAAVHNVTVAFQFAYYSPVCGVYTYAANVYNVSTQAIADDDTLMPIGDVSKAFVSLTTIRNIRDSEHLQWTSRLSEFINTDELFATDRYALTNVALAPRTAYSSPAYVTNSCALEPMFLAISPPVLVFVDNSSTEYTKASMAESQWLALTNAAGATRTFCTDDAPAGLQATVVERSPDDDDDASMQEEIRSKVIRSNRMCSLARSVCPSTDVPPASLLDAVRGDRPLPNYALTHVNASVWIAWPGELGQATGSQCYSTAVDLMRLFFGVFANDFMTPDERQAFESSFVECSTIFDDPALTCAPVEQLVGASSSFWSSPGFVRFPSATTARNLINRQLTLSVDNRRTGALVGMWDSLGSIAAYTSSDQSSALGAALLATVPALDPTIEHFVVDSTSSLLEPSLGPSPGVAAAAASTTTESIQRARMAALDLGSLVNRYARR